MKVLLLIVGGFLLLLGAGLVLYTVVQGFDSYSAAHPIAVLSIGVLWTAALVLTAGGRIDGRRAIGATFAGLGGFLLLVGVVLGGISFVGAMEEEYVAMPLAIMLIGLLVAAGLILTTGAQILADAKPPAAPSYAGPAATPPPPAPPQY